MSARPYVILTDSTTDLPLEYLEAHQVGQVPLTFTLDGQEYDGTPGHTLEPVEFYHKMREGAFAQTSQISPPTFYTFFENELKQGNDILYLCFSSGLSGTYQSCKIACEDLLEKYPDAKIRYVDTLCASLGEGLLVDFAVRHKEAGMGLEELAALVEATKLQVCHYFTVDDLKYLCRGGRVSKTAAVFGTMLGIKPVLHVDDEGHLIPVRKVRGRKASLDELVTRMGNKLGDYQNPYVYISHGDCLKDAEYVAGLVQEKYGIPTEVMHFIGPVIGAHSGPGTVALFFIGSDRHEEKA